MTPGGKTALVALDKATGNEIWRSEVSASAHYSSAIAIREKGATAIVQGTGDGLVVLDAKDGKTLWTNAFCRGNTANCPSPVYADGYLFWANGYGKGGLCAKVEYHANRWKFAVIWTSRDMVCHHGGYIVEKGHVYGNHNKGWSCIELKSGLTKWKNEHHAAIGKGSLCFADGMLVLFGEKGGLVGLAPASPNGLTLTGQFRVAGSGPSWAHPVVTDGQLFVRYAQNLYCYDVRASVQRTP